MSVETMVLGFAIGVAIILIFGLFAKCRDLKKELKSAEGVVDEINQKQAKILKAVKGAGIEVEE